MVKHVLALIATAILLAGCATTQHFQITSKTIPVGVPLIYSPAPPTVNRPQLPITTIQKTDSDGVVVKKYAASVQALLGYSEQLEKIVQNYKNINQAYSVQRQKLIEKWKQKTGTDITVPDPTLPQTSHK